MKRIEKDFFLHSLTIDNWYHITISAVCKRPLVANFASVILFGGLGFFHGRQNRKISSSSVVNFQSDIMSSGMPELGSKISLISKADIRYEGRLFTVDPQECTIALASGKLTNGFLFMPIFMHLFVDSMPQLTFRPRKSLQNPV